ncbi:PqiC family protein [Lichenicoccus sp.]|uniref:PqiC family protein n=1 Tax=Lichenicoccus sp. TaxID=2781899 RepID=UPI003D0AC6C8
MTLPRQAPLSRRRLLGLASALPLSACGSGEPDYYTLAVSPGTPQPGGPLTVEVRTPSVTPYLDRDTIVRTETDDKLILAHGAAWAGALSDMIGRVLAADLGQRLPGSNVYAENGAISTQALALVELDVSRFLADAQDRAEMTANLSVHRPNAGPSGSRLLHLTGTTADSSVGALVASLSVLLGQVADVAADELRALPPRS